MHIYSGTRIGILGTLLTERLSHVERKQWEQCGSNVLRKQADSIVRQEDRPCTCTKGSAIASSRPEVLIAGKRSSPSFAQRAITSIKQLHIAPSARNVRLKMKKTPEIRGQFNSKFHIA